MHISAANFYHSKNKTKMWNNFIVHVLQLLQSYYIDMVTTVTVPVLQIFSLY